MDVNVQVTSGKPAGPIFFTTNELIYLQECPSLSTDKYESNIKISLAYLYVRFMTSLSVKVPILFGQIEHLVATQELLRC